MAQNPFKPVRGQNFLPAQMELYKQRFDQVSPNSYLSRLAKGDEAIFDEIEAPALRQFSQLQGQNASRFSNMGLGARRGSGFSNTMNQATSDFAQDLKSRRHELQMGAIRDLDAMSQELLGYEFKKGPKKRSFWEKIIGGAVPIAGAAIGGVFGGPTGALAGYNMGNSFNSSLRGSGQY